MSLAVSDHGVLAMAKVSPFNAGDPLFASFFSVDDIRDMLKRMVAARDAPTSDADVVALAQHVAEVTSRYEQSSALRFLDVCRVCMCSFSDYAVLCAGTRGQWPCIYA